MSGQSTPRGRYNKGPESIAEIVADHDRRLKAIEAGGRAGNTSVDRGSFTVKEGTFQVGTAPSVYFGPGGGTSIWEFRKDDGTLVFSVGGSPGNQFWAMYDDQGHFILSDDTVSGYGLANPYLPVPCYPHYNGTGPNPFMTTTSGTFTGAWITRTIAQQPYIFFVLLVKVTADSTTTGEIQLMDNNNSVVADGPTTIPINTFQRFTLGPYPLFGNIAYKGEIEFEVQIRRTAGTGTISVLMLNAYQRQS